MLEHIPHWLGQALTGVRAGHDKLTVARLDLHQSAELSLTSPAFASGGRLPERFTADGAGISPPLVWSGIPAGATSLALIVEDPDAPTPRPMVHAILLDIDPALGSLAEGAIAPDGAGSGGKNVGRNSGLSEGWLPPDPPTGHDSHDYVFQLFALRAGAPSDDAAPGRSDFLEKVRGRVLATGLLVGTYSRGEEAPVGPAAGGLARA
ncbi:YbhB/YbcL family Raf kinase inhibitor-like protein [Sphingomonas sp. BN140010]|uniref:YbhB/YbcL family Raf kinase inhibitor-like protein n=1 Tax=Sphingomonas arvum TaxID=2992113 RepID=A0ABT3JCG2_9SPHN|nr:YbhB/YbcL family Raf kinase inhibitor-like protein [Sphingomonas sp. BN140010]MCW3796726.1 YbhB/YbcL family Raf kinase inhibitor-like protein [Sphingomonas sp. BN140010]